MKRFAAAFLLLAACSGEAELPSLVTGEFAGHGRDRLCIAGDKGNYRAGVIAYAPTGDANCSASGRLEPAGSGWALLPPGEGPCRIPLAIEGNSVRVGDLTEACSYYCGPGASMSGKAFNRADMGAKAVDLAGDPLC